MYKYAKNLFHQVYNVFKYINAKFMYHNIFFYHRSTITIITLNWLSKPKTLFKTNEEKLQLIQFKRLKMSTIHVLTTLYNSINYKKYYILLVVDKKYS